MAIYTFQQLSAVKNYTFQYNPVLQNYTFQSRQPNISAKKSHFIAILLGSLESVSYLCHKIKFYIQGIKGTVA